MVISWWLAINNSWFHDNFANENGDFSGIFQPESHGDFMGLNGLMHVFFRHQENIPSGDLT